MKALTVCLCTIALSGCLPASVSNAAAVTRDRSVRVTAAPGVGDASLVELGFSDGTSGALDAGDLHVAAAQPFGDDYLAVAVLRGRAKRAFALVADRATGLLDPSFVHLDARMRRSLGVLEVRRAENVLAHASTVSFCQIGGLSGASLLAIDSQGQPLKGLGAGEAIAQAYDIACGLPHSSALEEAVKAPAPGGCVPCDPTPGRACPLTARATVCVTARTAGSSRLGSD